MTMAKKILGAALGDGDGDSKLYVDDVFSTYLYTGNDATQTINNGIDLAGKGGMVWHKTRGTASAHIITDTARGSGYQIYPNTAGADSFNSTYALSFKTNGFTENYGYGTAPVVSWTFRRSPKFLDVVTYTGNGASSRAIAHSLGQEVGMVVTKATSTTGDWNTYHRSATGDLVLNTTAAQTGSKALVNSATTSTFTVSGAANTNAVAYVAYLFAHDPSADGIIQCGSYIGYGNATGPIVNLGWEPQYLMVKNASGTGNWQIIDSMRGMPVGSADATLQANLNNAESSVDYVSPTATGFQVTSSSEVNSSDSTYIYMAIRRSNKPPTTGTEVYNAIARTGTSAVATVTGVGFAPDLLITSARDVTANGNGGTKVSIDKLRGGGALLQCGYSVAEVSGLTDQITSFDVGGVTLGADTTYGSVNYSTLNYIDHFFKRAPGFFDVVCYTGTNPYGGQVNSHKHSLGVMPELVIVKSRGTATNNNWLIIDHINRAEYTNQAGFLPSGFLNSAAAFTSSLGAFICFTSIGFTGSSANISGTSTCWYDEAGKTYVMYLFATFPGISKVGRYTGNGSSQTVECGFTAGARFILIKRTDSTGDWYVWDTARGIVAANDPHLSLNTPAAEVTTDDSVDPHASGFIVNQVAATNINVSGGQYIFLAIA